MQSSNFTHINVPFSRRFFSPSNQATTRFVVVTHHTIRTTLDKGFLREGEDGARWAREDD